MNKTKSRLPKYIEYVLDYGPVIATVMVATFASLSAVRSGITADEMLQWILVILALLATTQFLDRFRVMRDINAKADYLIEHAQGLSGADSFFVDRMPSLENRLRKAQSIAINGITLIRTSNSFWGTFKQRIEEGSQIRLLVVDPDHQAIVAAANRFHKHQDSDRLRREVEQAMDNFASLMNQVNSKHLFQVRLLPAVPPYGIWLIDTDSPKAEMWVELYSFRDEPEPTFQLLPHRDGKRFTFFQSQFEMMWNASRIWEPNSAVRE